MICIQSAAISANREHDSATAVIVLHPIAERYIELPNYGQVGSARWYGANFQTKLIRKLVEKNLRVRLPDDMAATAQPENEISVTIDIEELSFSVGRRGERMFFGFAKGSENPYNDGLNIDFRNEFPLTEAPGWFGSTFRDYGGLHTGLEIGHEINFEAIFAGAKVKRLPYRAKFGAEITYTTGSSLKKKSVSASAGGFYFDLSAHIGYGTSNALAALTWARTDALFKAFDRAVDAAAKEISTHVESMALRARLVQQLKALATTTTKSRLGSSSSALSTSETSEGLSSAAISRETNTDLSLSDKNLSITPLVKKYKEGFWRRLWNALSSTVTLPYRIWRYFQYDQDYLGAEKGQMTVERATNLVRAGGAGFWAHRQFKLPELWSRVGIGDRRTTVAIIDSGLDYNQGTFDRSVYWDMVHESPGWDFISWDARPFDDHAHGTEVASVIGGGWDKTVGVAPGVALLPIKAISPYGQTSSAALAGAFDYAIASGAKIIVCGWATRIASRALHDAALAAKSAGVLVVAAAGDDRQDLDQDPQYPAAFSSELDNVISVAAYGSHKIAHTTNATEMLLWDQPAKKKGSGFGARSVDIAAPGEKIAVRRPRNKGGTQSHTGLAAGWVAGLAALSWHVCPTLTPNNFKKALLKNASFDAEFSGQVHDSKTLYDSSVVDFIYQHCNNLKASLQ